MRDHSFARFCVAALLAGLIASTGCSRAPSGSAGTEIASAFGSRASVHGGSDRVGVSAPAPASGQPEPAAPAEPGEGASLGETLPRGSPGSAGSPPASVEQEGWRLCRALLAGSQSGDQGQPIPSLGELPLTPPPGESLRAVRVAVAERKGHATADLIWCETNGGILAIFRDIETGAVEKVLGLADYPLIDVD